MAYVKILDSKIIDLASWQQVINVVNQHSDSIAQLTNNFNSSWSQVYNSTDDWSSSFDMGSNLIVFGRAKLTQTATSGNGLYNANTAYNSGEKTFSQNPMIVATSEGGSTDKHKVTVTVTNVGTSTFDVYAEFPSGVTISDEKPVYVNWIAIGPK